MGLKIMKFFKRGRVGDREPILTIVLVGTQKLLKYKYLNMGKI